MWYTGVEYCRARPAVALLFPGCYLVQRIYGWTVVTWIIVGMVGLREAAKKVAIIRRLRETDFRKTMIRDGTAAAAAAAVVRRYRNST